MAGLQGGELVVQDGANLGRGRVMGEAPDEVDVAFDELRGEDVVAVGADASTDGFWTIEEAVSAGDEDIWCGLHNDMEQ